MEARRTEASLSVHSRHGRRPRFFIRYHGRAILMAILCTSVCAVAVAQSPFQLPSASKQSPTRFANHTETDIRHRTFAPPALARVESQNFIVQAGDGNLAKQVAHLAERYRKSLAVEWLGHELEPWHEKCPITVEIAPQSGGETSFVFEGPPGAATPTRWSMRIFGTPDRLLDAVLPHEITHTIFATHFGQPLPRWADEGACTTVEHESERAKIQELLVEYLSARPSKGIPFNRLFVMMQYPEEMLPLYAQSYSLSQFLILQKGRQHFVQYVGEALGQMRGQADTRTWDAMTRKYYGYRDLSELQLSWQAWVRKGSMENAVASYIPSSDQSDAGMATNASALVSEMKSQRADVSLLSRERDSRRNSLGWYGEQMQATEIADRTADAAWTRAHSIDKDSTKGAARLIEGELSLPLHFSEPDFDDVLPRTEFKTSQPTTVLR